MQSKNESHIFNGHYVIYETGILKSIKFGKEKVISPSISRKGYSKVTLYDNGVKRSFLVHRLVAEAFIPNPEGLPCVCHKKESFPLDNSKENLFWGTHKDNMMDMIRKGRMNNVYKNGIHPSRGKFGKYSPKAKPILQYSLSGEFIREWGSARDVNNELGIAYQNISNCCLGKCKSAGKFIWKYKKLGNLFRSE